MASYVAIDSDGVVDPRWRGLVLGPRHSRVRFA